MKILIFVLGTIALFYIILCYFVLKEKDVFCNKQIKTLSPQEMVGPELPIKLIRVGSIGFNSTAPTHWIEFKDTNFQIIMIESKDNIYPTKVSICKDYIKKTYREKNFVVMEIKEQPKEAEK